MVTRRCIIPYIARRFIGKYMRQQKGQQLKIRMSDQIHADLKRKAEAEERSMNYLINKAVELFLSKESAKA